jgi:hypothetical protein
MEDIMNSKTWTLALCTLLAACGGDKEGDTSNVTDGESDGSESCEISATPFPADGEADAFYRTSVEFTLDGADATATLALTDASGAAVAGTSSLSDDQKTVYFTPAADLTSGASYTSTLTFCGGNPSATFTVGSLGAPVADPNAMVGKTYTVQLSAARFVKPPGVADLLLGQLTDDVLLGVSGIDGSSIQMLGALSEGAGGPQNTCSPSIDFPVADFSENPFVNIGPENVTIEAAGLTIPIANFNISGAFAADGSYFGGGVLSGQLDARDLAPALADTLGTSDPTELCGLLAGFGVSCAPCADGQSFCVDVLADDITALEKSGTTLECVSQTDCHPSCAASTCADPNAGVCE